MNEKINHLDLFSGIGGFSLGLKYAGVKHGWHGNSDIDSYANEVFKRRFPDAERLGSVVDVSYESIGRRIDLLTGGFPCQAFSLAGARKGFADTRGTLFFEIERILQDYIKHGEPIPYFLLENVKGLLSHDDGRTFAVIYRVLADLDYTIECQLVNTKWWLPQNRERIYIFGRYNGNKCGRKVFPITKDDIRNTEIKLCREAASGQEGDMQNDKSGGRRSLYKSVAYRTRAYKGEEGHIEERGDNLSNALNTQPKDYMIKREEITIKNPYNGYTSTKQTGTLGTSCGTKTGKTAQHIHTNTSIRRLTPIECERLQGFPDNWTDQCSDTQRYKQCGNAVSVPVVQTIMEKIYAK